MFSIKLISLNGFFGVDKNEQEIDIIDDYISTEFFKQMETIYGIFTVDCDICSDEEEFKNSLINSTKDNDAVVILGGLSKKSKINAKELVSKGLSLDLKVNEQIKEKNNEFALKQDLKTNEEIDFMALIPSCAEPFLMESSFSYSYVLNLGDKFVIHTSHEKNEVQKCLGTKVIPYLLKNTESNASVEEISLTGLSDKQLATFPIQNEKNTSFCMYKVGNEIKGRIVVNKNNIKKSEKYMDKLFEKIEKWANGDYLRKEIKQESQNANSSFKLKKAILMCCILVIFGGVGYYAVRFIPTFGDNKETAQVSANPEEPDEVEDDGYPDDYLPEFKSLYEENEDIKGDIKVKGTNIDFPVVQKGDNNFYKDKDFSGENDEHGTPFLDYEVDLLNSENFIIYGKNLNDGEMFSDFVQYKNLEFYKEHPVIKFDNVYAEGSYKIVAVLRASANKDHKNVFGYQNFVNSESEQDTKDFLKEISRRTLINTGVEYDEDDKFLTISTNTDEFDGARFVVVARKVRDNEDEEVDTSESKLNEKALMPDVWYELYGGTKPVFDDEDEEVLSDTSESKDDNKNTQNNQQQQNNSVKVNNIKLSQNEGMLFAGISYKLSATVYPYNATNKNVVWESDDEEVLTTDQNGRITAVSEGVANVTAKSEDGEISDSCKIIVKSDGVKVTGISFNSNERTLIKGKSLTLNPTISPDDAKNKSVSYKSSNANVATVDNNGKVTAVSLGKAKITATTKDGGKTAIIDLTVKDDAVLVEEVEINKDKLTLEIGDEYTFTTNVYPKNADNTEVLFKSTDEDVVTVHRNGTIEALKEGKSTILAYVKGTEVFAECVVTVEEENKHEDEPETDYTSGDVDRITVKNQNGRRVRDDAYDIVCKIVQSEVGGGFSDEAIKAQAVATYTYLMYNVDRGVTPTVTLSNSVTSKIKHAVSDVFGEAIYYNGKYINAVYHSASSGYTTSAKKVWGSSVSYLVPVESEGDEDCKYYGYEKSFSERDIERKIEDYFDIDPYDYGEPEEWFEDIDSDSGDYVESIRVCGKKITGRQFREGLMGFSIYSHAFEVDYDGRDFVITTYGYGHGVGMSQYGAEYLSSEGYDYDEILEHYYKGTRVK